MGQTVYVNVPARAMKRYNMYVRPRLEPTVAGWGAVRGRLMLHHVANSLPLGDGLDSIRPVPHYRVSCVAHLRMVAP